MWHQRCGFISSSTEIGFNYVLWLSFYAYPNDAITFSIRAEMAADLNNITIDIENIVMCMFDRPFRHANRYDQALNKRCELAVARNPDCASLHPGYSERCAIV